MVLMDLGSCLSPATWRLSVGDDDGQTYEKGSRKRWLSEGPDGYNDPGSFRSEYVSNSRESRQDVCIGHGLE